MNKYKTIVCDPPWPIKKSNRKLYPNQVTMDYPLMSISEIRALPVSDLSETDAHLYLWTTHKHLPTALNIVHDWGFSYHALMTWVKDGGFTPFSYMFSTEHVIFARRGNLPLLKMGKRLDFTGERREHSRKPETFYERVIECSPGPRLEMFARQRREGFDAHGNEVEKFGGPM